MTKEQLEIAVKVKKQLEEAEYLQRELNRITNAESKFEVGYWYYDAKSRRLEDRAYLYKCKYVDSDVSILGRYFDGACLGTFSTPTKGNKYLFSSKNDMNQRIDFYKKDRFNLMCEIKESLLSISQNIHTITDLEEYLSDQESTESYVKSAEATSCDRHYDEIRALAMDSQYLEQIQKFFSKS